MGGCRDDDDDVLVREERAKQGEHDPPISRRDGRRAEEEGRVGERRDAGRVWGLGLRVEGWGLRVEG